MAVRGFYFYVFVAFHITAAISVPDTPCTRRRANETKACAGSLAGCFIVSCEADGSFTPRQCSGSTGIESNVYLSIC